MPFISPVKIVNGDGRTIFVSCTCMQIWWPLVTKMAQKRGIVLTQIDVSQGSYNTSVSASADTHSGGGVLDLRQYSMSLDDLLEEAGAASFVRLPADGFTYHTHMILIGCPHLPDSAKRQVEQWKAGRNALRSNLPDRDTTRPTTIRTWQQGVVWMQTQLSPIPRISYSATMVGVMSGKFSGNVRIVQDLLRRNGGLYKYPVDGIWGPRTKEAYKRYQNACGYSGAAANGIPGFATFKRLVEWRNNYRAAP